MNPIGFIKSVIAELRLVEWLSANEVMKLSLIVFAVMTLLGAFLFLLDFLFLKLRDIIF